MRPQHREYMFWLNILNYTMYDKYIIFSPFSAGFCNILLSYEIAFALAHITKRSIIMPPTNWCVLIDDRSAAKESWQNIWQVLDLNAAKQNFNLIDLLDFAPIRPYRDEYYSSNHPYSWSGNIASYINDVYDYTSRNPMLTSPDPAACVYSSESDLTDLEYFADHRPTYDLNVDNRFLNIQGCLFGHYWYFVYAGNKVDRTAMKKRVNNSLRYKAEYYKESESLINGNYNAVHIRDPKQLNFSDYPMALDFKDNPDLLLDRIQHLYKNDKPLYVSTDIKELETNYLFSKIRQEYDLLYLDKFKLDLRPLEAIAIDQILCSRADLFYGTYCSTFTKRINTMRGLNNMQFNDSGGFNKTITSEDNDAMPWIGHGHWAWHMSSKAQCIYE